MNKCALFALISFLGAAVSIASAVLGTRIGGSDPTVIHAREIVLVNEDGVRVAEFKSERNGSVLRFFDPADKSEALALGIEHSCRYLRFFGPNRELVAAINAVPPSGASTLYLGDQRVQARVILGAQFGSHGGIDQDYTDRWGLEFRNPHDVGKALLRITALPVGERNTPTAFFEMNGTHPLVGGGGSAGER